MFVLSPRDIYGVQAGKYGYSSSFTEQPLMSIRQRFKTQIRMSVVRFYRVSRKRGNIFIVSTPYSLSVSIFLCRLVVIAINILLSLFAAGEFLHLRTRTIPHIRFDIRMRHILGPRTNVQFENKRRKCMGIFICPPIGFRCSYKIITI